MNDQKFIIWISIVATIGALWGIVFAFFGLGILPVSREVLVPWGNGVYGATFIGFSVTIFFAGRHAFRKNDNELMKAILYGIWTWLVIEALFSLYYGVFFNFAVDIGIFILFSIPLVKGMRNIKKQNK